MLMLLLAALTLPMAQAPPVERAVSYGPDESQRLDLHWPAQRPWAAVMFIHGGSLMTSGERRDSPMYATICPALAAAGVACATIDYRLAPAHKWPAMPEDAAAAFSWFRTRLQRDAPAVPVFVFGHSSGCHLASILGAQPRFLSAQALSPSDIAGIVAMGCVLSPTEDVLARRTIEELRARWRPDEVHSSADSWLDADPSRFIGQHMPPTLVLLADGERFFPAILEQGAKFARRLLEMRRPADVVIVPGRHVSSISGFGRGGDPVLRAVLDFFRNPGRMPG